MRINGLIYGIGNVGNIKYKDNLKLYHVWFDMLKRCYCPKYLHKHTSYIGCSVCAEWHSLEKFKLWYDEHYIDGYQLDKDILIDGNKVYSKETCIFIPKYLNVLFVNAYNKSLLPTGVMYHKRDRKYMARIKNFNKYVYLGEFLTPDEAHNTWLKAKREYARKLAIDAYMNNEIDERIMNAIIIKAYNLI